MCPWADCLYAADLNWWKHRNGAPEFSGIKISQDEEACRRYDVNKVKLGEPYNKILVDKAGTIAAGGSEGSGGNSGFQAKNIAVQFGAAKIALVGFDMRLDLGDHWHGRHPKGMNNPSTAIIAKWRKTLNENAPLLAQLGIDVVNCSEISALTAFPKMTMKECFERWKL